MRIAHRLISTAALICVTGLGTAAPAYADDPALPIGHVVGLMTHVGSNPDKCMEIGDGSTDTNMIVVHQGTCKRHAVGHALYGNQKWRLIAAPGLSPDRLGFYHVQLQNFQSNQCMTESPNGLGTGLDLIVMSDCVTGQKSQQWIIQEWEDWAGHGWAFTMESDLNDRGLRVQDGSAQDNALIVGTYRLADESLWAPVTDPAPGDTEPCMICHF